MKHKTIQQLRDSLNKVLKHGRPKQLNKLRKAYHGKRLKAWWAAYAKVEGLSIAECKEFEGIKNNNMKGGHTHNHQRNALERKLNRSKESRNRCHNVLNKGYEYKYFKSLGNF